MTAISQTGFAAGIAIVREKGLKPGMVVTASAAGNSLAIWHCCQNESGHTAVTNG